MINRNMLKVRRKIMSEHTPRLNRLLIFVAVFLCLICGILFTQSSAGPFESSSTSVVSRNTRRYFDY